MHQFSPSIGSNLCIKCKRSELDHTAMATCDSCDYVGQCELYFNNLLLCPECTAKEEQVRMSPEAQEQRVNDAKNDFDVRSHINETLKEARSIDYSLQVKEDIFNAETIAIVEIQKAIEADTTIENKHYKLAEEVTARLRHFSKLIYERQNENVNDANKQRADQAYLNQLQSKLRLEEREKLKLQFPDYKPSEKPIKQPKAVKTAPKFDKKELVAKANELNELLAAKSLPPMVTLASLQTTCVGKNMTPEQAFNHWKGVFGL